MIFPNRYPKKPSLKFLKRIVRQAHIEKGLFSDDNLWSTQIFAGFRHDFGNHAIQWTVGDPFSPGTAYIIHSFSSLSGSPNAPYGTDD
jgi:hypothetical protein